MNFVKFSKALKLSAIAATCFILTARTSQNKLPPQVDASSVGTG